MLSERMMVDSAEWTFGRPGNVGSDVGYRSFPARADAASDGISIPFCDNEIPHFAGPELERLYNNLYASLDQLTLNGPAAGTSTWVLLRAGTPAPLSLPT